MTLLNSPLMGMRCMLKGFTLIFQPQVRAYVIMPLLINIVLFVGLFIALWQGLDQLNLWLASLLPSWLDWLQWLVKPLFFMLAMVSVFFSFAWLGNLIAGYFNGLLSSAVERHLTGTLQTTADAPWYMFFPQIGVEIGQALFKIRHTLGWLVFLVILTLIPVVNVIAPVLWFLYGAWFLAFEYLENPMGNHGLNFNQSQQAIGKQRLIVFSFGSTAMLCNLIPVVNFFTLPAGVAGATYLWLKHFDRNAKID